MLKITSALDIAVSCSSSKGFPNTIGEAMVCGVPCVVIDVGDSTLIAGEVAVVVEPRNSNMLATALAKMMDLSPEKRRALGNLARSRIVSEFSIDKLVQRTECALGLIRCV